MPTDASIFANALRPLPTIQDYTAANLANQQNALKVQSDQQSLTDQNALRQATMQLGNDPNQNLQTLRQAGLFAPSQAYQAALYNNQKTQSETGRNVSEIPLNQAKTTEQSALAGQHDLDTQVKSHDFAVQQLGAITDPSQVPQWLHENTGPGKAFSYDQGMQGYQNFQQALQQPGGFDAWKQQALQGGMSATDQLKQKQAAQIAAQAQDAENARNAATNQTHIQAANIGASTSRANNQDMLAKDYATAGLNPDGTPTANQQATVDLIGRGQMAAPTGAALRNPRMAAMMDQVGQQYAGQDAAHPVFDAGNYTAKQQALKSFATGKDGQAVQSANTAVNHLQTLQDLAAAQANGNIPLFNQLANRFSQETGGAAPTNLAGAITMVGPEISKAIVGAGGTGGDREKVDAALQAIQKGSPAQAAGQLATMRDLFGGRLTEAQRTYQRTTGKTDFAQTLLSPAAQQLLTNRAGSGAQANPNSVATPDGRVHTFPNAAAAAAFKKDAGL